MIVKMKFINISGPRDDIDRVMDLYLSRYEIQLESALTELKTVENLRPFVEINPYRDALLKAQQYVSYLNEPEKIAPDTSMGLDDIFELIRATNEEYLTFQARKDVLKRKQDELQAKQKVIEPFRPMDGDLGRILSFRYITCRFGKLPAVPEDGKISDERPGSHFRQRAAGCDKRVRRLLRVPRGGTEGGCCVPFPAF